MRVADVTGAAVCLTKATVMSWHGASCPRHLRP